ncbi:GDSL-type esterase/lipase family protein [Pedobacter metabolipauper]|uniref:Lysophospholipase L1-like esterase n=1 Tax=Pedobacter metabolipauper TaxID=425513 RepID=A0A4R6SZZ2_9SPHI|nr:GDSL-type esterase/lipase family protein [Pedobacter metabolipauper]TDQ10342.1 lysophospholipase L1-like esterase [Pedobacter metabolipauper]
MKKIITAFVLAVFVSLQTTAQDKPFWNEIQNFKKQDSLSRLKKNSIVFIGSSSFRMWNDAETIFKKYNVINRGFGGSGLKDANDYIKELVLDYKPKQVVIYSGENDIASGVSGKETFERFSTFFNNIRTQLPKTNIAYVSMKLSPSRIQFAEELLKANALIEEYIKTQKNASYIDITSKMLDSAGKLRPDLFLNDMLHMNPKGYAIWQEAITPYLIK